MRNEILIRPFVTEKMTALMDKSHYAFEVQKDANKIQIRQAVEARYPGVKIKEVRTMVVRGKHRRQFTRRGPVDGHTSAFKKAIVTLMPDSEPIDFFEQI